MAISRLPTMCPDVIVAVFPDHASVIAYGITERGIDFLHVDSGDPPAGVFGRSKYGWLVMPALVDGVVRRAEAAGLIATVAQRPAWDASQAMRHWRDEAARAL